MKILVVDGDCKRLMHTEELVRSVFPADTIVTECDPLMAGKYAFTNPVDVVLAAWKMQRMDGPEMASFVHKAHPGTRVILTGCPEERTRGNPREAEALLAEPLTEKTLRMALES